MAQRLEIYLDGPSDHLGDDTRGVSVEFFVEYATKLRKAYRRTAQSILAGEIQESGRLNDRAKEVDIRIVRATAGSLDSSYIAVDNSINPQLSFGLAGATMETFCNSLQDARDGKEIPGYVGNLLESVPEDVSQRFRYSRDGQLVSEVTVNSGMIDVPGDMTTVAGVRRVLCTVRGVTWEPHPMVLLRDENNKKRDVPSTEILLNKALTLRHEKSIVATIVLSKAGTRLIALKTVQERKVLPRPPTTAQTMERFANVHAELAK